MTLSGSLLPTSVAPLASERRDSADSPNAIVASMTHWSGVCRARASVVTLGSVEAATRADIMLQGGISTATTG